jgi:N-acetylglucosaminyldiphosphoundecaprenol N-acetyl-beta-D-mannosaminyltransferase
MINSLRTRPIAAKDSAQQLSVPKVSILGVTVSNASKAEAYDAMADLVNGSNGSSIFLVNAHTLNLAVENPHYQAALNTATYVYGDGTGVRWAAKWRGVKIKDNLVGTDLLPEFFHATAYQGYRYFLLGADQQTIERAAQTVKSRFHGWELVGYHHGYLTDELLNQSAIAKINAAQPHLLLVAMGNPLQEQWICAHRDQLQVSLSIGVGGLFDYWGGNLIRAPRGFRKWGFEWLYILCKQPHKWQRYIIGNVKFLFRMMIP